MTTNFMGMPVEGSIIRGDKRADQLPLSDLTPLIDVVLKDPNVLKFGWTQYTPYFMDGDPCVFGVNSLWADPVNADDANEDDDDYYGYIDGIEYDPRWGEIPQTWNHETREYTYGTYQPPLGADYESTYRNLLALNEAIDAGSFDNVLLELFGDHARVVIHKDKVVIEQYEHD